MNYRDAVAEGRRLVKEDGALAKRSAEIQWRLAELTWEQCVNGGKSQTRWAEDIGVHQTHVSRLVRIWAKWGGQDVDTRPPWAQVYNEAIGRSQTEEVEEHGSHYAANARRAIRNLPPERKAEVVEELLDDADQQVRHAAIRALDKHYDRDRELRRAETPTRPASQYDASIEFLVRLRAISAAIKNATDLVMTAPRFGETGDFATIIDRQIYALSVMRDVLIGRPGMDDELAKILSEG